MLFKTCIIFEIFYLLSKYYIYSDNPDLLTNLHGQSSKNILSLAKSFEIFLDFKFLKPSLIVTGNRIISRTFRDLNLIKNFLKKGGLAFPFLQNPKNQTKPSLRSLNRYRVIEAY